MELLNGQDNPLSPILSKTKRISIALYRITDFLDYNEPLRLRIRLEALELLSSVMSLINPSQPIVGSEIKDIYKSANQIMTYIDVLLYVNLLSETNSRIIKDEVLSLSSLVGSSSRVSLAPAFDAREFLDKLALAGSSDILAPRETSAPRSIGSSSRDTYISGISTKASTSSAPVGHKDKRKTAILDYLGKHKGAGVRDLAAVIKGCSEKTIQRELAALVGEGTLRKEGERRWSKYFLSGTSH